MKYLFTLYLILSWWFFSFPAENIEKQGNIIWDDGTDIDPPALEGCCSCMRWFGTNDQYLCNCKGLDCDFGKGGKCHSENCIFGYGGEFCQKILYHNYLKSNISKEKNVFTDESIQIKNSLDITFEYQYRIHLIKIKCSSSEATISLSIGSEKFCEGKCHQITKCQGDATGKDLHIQTTSEISLSNVKVYGCSPFWFGEDCDKQCHCAQNSECHKMSGNCPMGCESGRSGPGCQTLHYVNVGLNKTASQSSTYSRASILINNTCKQMNFNFSANLAVDGNTDQQNERRSCMHTGSGSEQNPRWKVDLGKEYYISQIRIYNRNTNEDRLNGSTIKVGGEYCHYIKKATRVIDINCSRIIRGRTIEITKSQGYLHFCEVEVLQCLPGFYGNRCSNRCPGCKNSSCDQWSGECRLGCAPGYKKELNKSCTECLPGFYGHKCGNGCPGCKDLNCDQRDGRCLSGCAPGYKENQNKTCSECSGCKYSICNQQDGRCVYGCADGYKENQDSTCTECSGCKDSNCDQQDGRCLSGCAPGYKKNQDSTCTVCNVGTYGEECSGTCRCKNINACDKRNGFCGSDGCETGYKGISCQYPKSNVIILIAVCILFALLLIICAGCAIYFKCKGSTSTASNIPPQSQLDTVPAADSEEHHYDELDESLMMVPPTTERRLGNQIPIYLEVLDGIPQYDDAF